MVQARLQRRPLQGRPLQGRPPQLISAESENEEHCFSFRTLLLHLFVICICVSIFFLS
jgi:hypothetical protein